MFLFPLRCRLCCEVQYCSQSCRDRAWSQYHKVECSLGPLLKMVGILSPVLTVPVSDLSSEWEVLSCSHLEDSCWGQCTSPISQVAARYVTLPPPPFQPRMLCLSVSDGCFCHVDGHLFFFVTENPSGNRNREYIW